MHRATDTGLFNVILFNPASVSKKMARDQVNAQSNTLVVHIDWVRLFSDIYEMLKSQ